MVLSIFLLVLVIRRFALFLITIYHIQNEKVEQSQNKLQHASIKEQYQNGSTFSIRLSRHKHAREFHIYMQGVLSKVRLTKPELPCCKQEASADQQARSGFSLFTNRVRERLTWCHIYLDLSQTKERCYRF